MASQSHSNRKFERCLAEREYNWKTRVEVVKDGMKMLHVALERNIVAFFENAYGQTLVAVQLMKQMAHELRADGKKSLIIFLAPEIRLVREQAEVIAIHTDLRVAHTSGSKSADGWKAETTLNEVLVTTPQILLDSLQVCFVNLDLVDLLIFDECHHALEQNSYAKIMKDHYSKCQHKPKVFGMTTSALVGKDVDKLLITVEGILDAVKSGLLTPKVHLLVQLLLQHRVAEEMHCIIYVDRVIIAAVISSLMQQLDFLSFIPGDHSYRGFFAMCEKKTLRYSSIGKVNVLVATDAVEEDIYVQSCSCVIRFDLPKTIQSFIQSRGHARQSDSNFIILIERGNEKQQKLLYEIINSEESMMSLNINSTHTPCLQEKRTVEAAKYWVSSIGDTITCESSVKTTVNSRTSDLIVDESDNILVDNVNDISNHSGSPDGGLASEVNSHHGKGNSSIPCSQSISSPVILQKMELQGFPRTALYELCAKHSWPAPAFDFVNELVVSHVRSFVYSVHIPGTEFVKVCGEAESSKKRALDSASLQMLRQFQKKGICRGVD